MLASAVPTPATEQVLAPGALDGVRIGYPADAKQASRVADRAAQLGAEIIELAESDYPNQLEVVIATADGSAELANGLDKAWEIARTAANQSMIPHNAGLVLLLAPRAGNPDAAALHGAVENLARVLSIEWSQYKLRAVAVLPGEQTTDAELAELCSYLASPAATYFSGCAFKLGAL